MEPGQLIGLVHDRNRDTANIERMELEIQGLATSNIAGHIAVAEHGMNRRNRLESVDDAL